MRAPISITAALLLVLSCQPEPRVETSSSSTIALEADALWLTSPDDDEVVQVDAGSLDVRSRWTVEGQPEHLLRIDGGWVVSLRRGHGVAVLEDGGTESRHLALPCGATAGLARTADGGVLVTCPDDDRVLQLDRTAREVLAQAGLAGRPIRVAVGGERIFVALERGQVAELDRSLAEIGRTPLVTTPGFAATRVFGLSATARGGLIASYQRVDHDSDRARPPERGGYGAVEDGTPRIEPRLLARCGGRYARFDGGARVLSGPSAIAWAADRLWIVHSFTGRVAVLRCRGEGMGPAEAEAEVLAVFRVGAGARGITVSPDGTRAWVDVGFDHAIARLELPDSPNPERVEEPTLERVRETGPRRLSPIAERGRRLFFDATDTHLTPSGVVTCGTCHPGGGDDGLRWFLHTRGVPRKVRRTPPVWDAAGRPLHWDGEFADGAVLSGTTIRELMDGDGLLVDLDAMRAFMAELPPPVGAPGGPRADEGERVFDDAGCASCHPGGRSDARHHRTLDASPDPDAVLAEARSPDLRGVRGRAPYFHDGRAEDLGAVLRTPGPHDVSARPSAEFEALLRYLETL